MAEGQHVDYEVVVNGETSTFKEARFASDTKRGFTFQRWHVEPKLSTEHPENELVEHNGRWLLPRHADDEMRDEMIRDHHALSDEAD